MVVIITMKNVIKRDGTYYFRITVPKDCQESVGKTEITQSLKTKDDAKAAVAAMDLNRQWKKKFDSLRTANPSIPVTVSGLNETVSDFRAALNAHMDQHLSDFLDRQSEEDLLMHSREYRYKMSTIARNEKNVLNFSEELGIEYPLPKQILLSLRKTLQQRRLVWKIWE